MTQIIALAGPKSSGKSTLSALLRASRRFYSVPFADPIKGMLGTLLGYERVPEDRIWQMLHGDQKEVPTALLGGKTPRYAMQTLGTEWRNLIDQNLWINAWGERTREMDHVVVDDLRFKHEAERVRTLGGKVFLIHRPSLHDFDDHPSENEWKEIPYDGVITNDGKPEEMLIQLEKFL